MADDVVSTKLQHITELDFDISRINDQFKKIETETADLVKNLDKILGSIDPVNFKIDENQISNQFENLFKSIPKSNIEVGLFNEDKIREQINNVKSITESQAQSLYTTMLREQEKTAQLREREQIRTSEATIRNADNLANYQQKLDLKLAAAREAQILKEQNYRIKSELKIAEEKEKLENKIRLLKERKNMSDTEEKQITKINSLYERTSALVKRIKDYRIDNQSLEARIQANLEESQGIWKKISLENGEITDEIRERIKYLSQETDILEAQVKASKNLNIDIKPQTTDIFGDWARSFKTAVSFRLTQLAEDAVVGTVNTLKEVEFGVMEITRVLNDASLDVEGFTSDLFNLATEYGRTFEETQDIVLRFAQTGETARDSLKLAGDTMLALNTAELSTEEATKSLIGIMQQWGFQTDDFLGVIDRINITADNFAVTSQDLVDALLRSSSVARTAGVSFEDLIGVLTVMKQSSGAAGREVGNAFKSILSYIQRPKSLKAFQDMGIDVFADEVSGELLPAMQILSNMADKWNNSSEEMQKAFMDVADSTGLFNEEIANALGIEDKYANAVNKFAEASDEANTAEKRLQATEAAGTYRKNYYIALMENFAQIQEVVTNMRDADGYSMAENAKYMDTLTAKYNQFITTLTEIANAAGNAGLTGLLKLSLDLATNLAQLLTTTDGLSAAIGTLTGIVIIANRSAFNPLIENVGKAIVEFSSFLKTMASMQGVSGAAAAGMGSLVGSFQAFMVANPAVAIGASISALSLLTGVIYKYQEAQHQERLETIAAGDDAIEKSNKLMHLKDKYIELSEIQERTSKQDGEYQKVLSDIIELLGNKSEALKLLSQDTEAYKNKLLEITEVELAEQAILVKNAEIAAHTEFKLEAGMAPGQQKQYIDLYVNAKNALEEYNEKIKEHNQLGEFDEANEISADKEYQNLTKLVQQREEIIKKELEAQVKTLSLQKQIADGIPETAEEIDKFANAIVEQIDANEGLNDIIKDIALNTLPTYTSELEDTNESLDDGKDIADDTLSAFESLSSVVEYYSNSLSELQSAYNTLSSAVNEYNETGYISIDSLNKLLSLKPAYLKYLVDEEGNLRLDEQALKDLAVAEAQEYEIAALRQLLDTISSFTNEAEAVAFLGEQNLNAADSVSALNSQISESISLLTQQGIITNNTANALGNYVSKLGALFQNTISGILNKKPSDVFVPSASYGGGSGVKTSTESWYDKQTEAFERLNKYGQKSTQDVIDFYRSMANSANVSADERMEAEDKLFSAIKTQLNETKKAQIDALNAQKKAIEEEMNARLESLKREQEEIKKNAQAEIDSLKKVEKENDRIREKEEYLRNRSEILEDLSSAQARSGIEARRAEKEAKQKLEDLDRDYKEKLEDYALEDKISEIEAVRDAQLEAINEQIAAVEEEKEARLAAIDEQIAAVNEKFNEANVNMMAYSEVFGDEIYNNYVGEFIEPMANGMVSGFEQANQIMVQDAAQNANDIYSQYQSNLIVPLAEALSSIKSMFDEISSLNNNSSILGSIAGVGAASLAGTIFPGMGISAGLLGGGLAGGLLGNAINNNTTNNKNITNNLNINNSNGDTDFNRLFRNFANKITSSLNSIP